MCHKIYLKIKSSSILKSNGPSDHPNQIIYAKMRLNNTQNSTKCRQNEIKFYLTSLKMQKR